MNNNICAVLVTYNPDILLLKNTILNIVKQVGYVIIVDNNSSNSHEVELFSETKVIVITLDENYGLAKAQNIGINTAGDLQADYVVIFDQDSSVDENFVGKLLEEYIKIVDSGEKIAAIGPMFYDRSSKYIYTPTKYKGPLIKKVDFDSEPVPVTFLIASGSMIKFSVFKEIGLMKECFFIDFVDVEWSLRAKYLGYSVYMTPRVTMAHDIGDERIKIFGRLISVHSDFRKYYIYRNGMYMLKLPYVPLGYKCRLFIFNIIRTTIGLFLSKDKKATLSVTLKAWKDGVLNRPNKKDIYPE